MYYRISYAEWIVNHFKEELLIEKYKKENRQKEK